MPLAHDAHEDHGTLLAVIRHGPDRRAIAAATGPDVRVIFCDDIADIPRQVVVRQPAAVLMELPDGTDEARLAAIVDLHRRLPSLPLCLYVAYTAADVRIAAHLACRGVVSGVVVRRVDPLAVAIREFLHRVTTSHDELEVLRVLAAYIPPTLGRFFVACANASGGPASIEDIARTAGLSLRTIEWHLQLHGLPTPQRVFGWCRVLRVARRLARSEASVKQVAAEFGYPSAIALARHLKRQTGLTPKAVRGVAGYRRVAQRAIEAFRGNRRMGDGSSASSDTD
ncbi:MAG: helix-turn-helix transcriptional regulator [Gemmatimonadaceae bacterium]|nr:helix-turn-helix transcriptional regulator [Gemmatimonadaceae bacterium]